mgnify:FL=1
MAVSATVRKLIDGPRNVAFNLTGLGDGMGQETLVVKVDASALTPPGTVRVEKLTGTVEFGIVELFWDALVPVKFAELSGQFDLDYCRVGGLTNDAGGGKTGDILLSTVGFELNSTYTILLELVK